jgi:internalin A
MEGRWGIEANAAAFESDGDVHIKTDNMSDSTSVTEKARPRPWWTYLRLSLRGLIVLVLVIGGGLGWIVNRAKVQRDAVAAIKRAGGEVFYEWDMKGGMEIPNGKPWWPKWIVDLIGVDYFGNVVRVGYGEKISDVEMVSIGHLSRVVSLLLNGASITDEGLAHVKGLANLHDLYLEGNSITAAGLEHLKGLTTLRNLDLFLTQVDDAGLVHLKGLTNLRFLHLGGTKITNSGLAHLKERAGSSNCSSSKPRSAMPGWST